MPETPPASDTPKQSFSYAAGISTGITTFLVWVIDHTSLEAKEGLKLAAPVIGLISTQTIRLLVRRVDLLFGAFQLKRWIQLSEQEKARILQQRLTVSARKRLAEIEVELTDYRQQLRTVRGKMFTFFEW